MRFLLNPRRARKPVRANYRPVEQPSPSFSSFYVVRLNIRRNTRATSRRRSWLERERRYFGKNYNGDGKGGRSEEQVSQGQSTKGKYIPCLASLWPSESGLEKKQWFFEIFVQWKTLRAAATIHRRWKKRKNSGAPVSFTIYEIAGIVRGRAQRFSIVPHELSFLIVKLSIFSLFEMRNSASSRGIDNFVPFIFKQSTYVQVHLFHDAKNVRLEETFLYKNKEAMIMNELFYSTWY